MLLMAIGSRGSGRVPLARALSKLGIASRSEAGRLIEAGRVMVSGRVVTDPRHLVRPERTVITVDDGEAVTRAARIVILLHKPRGVVTTRSDPEGRPTVYDLIREAGAASGAGAHLAPVGRLDMASTGLLLFTNDTRLAHWLTDPETALPRVYLVTVRGRVEDETAEAIERGFDVDGERLQAQRITIRKRSNRESHLVVELIEGKNREIRRLMKARGHEVTRLARVSFGGLELGTLAPGKWRIVDEHEIKRAWPEAPHARATRGGDAPARKQPRR
jgi:23S rRNA pseudouridine2605 synthase